MLQRTTEFINEVRMELPKVSWPSRKALVDATIVVIVMTLIMATIVKILDTIYTLALGQLFRVS